MKIRDVTFFPAHPRLPRQALFPWGYVEDLNDARTTLADVFSILLEAIQCRDEPARQQKKHRGDRQIDEIHVNAPCQPLHLHGSARKVKTV